MTKAYDLAALVAKLKLRGLDVGEEVAKGIFEDGLDWLVESALVSKTPFDDLAVGLVVPLKAQVLAAIDKIDGKVG